MYLPRIGPANKYDPLARQNRPQGLLGVTQSFQPAQIDQGLLQQGMTMLQTPQAQSIDDSQGGPIDVDQLKAILAKVAAADPATGTGATPTAPAAPVVPGASTPTPVQTPPVLMTPQQELMAKFTRGVPSQLGLAVSGAVRSGLDSLGITNGIDTLRGGVDSRLGSAGMRSQIPPEIQAILRSLGVGR